MGSSKVGLWSDSKFTSYVEEFHRPDIDPERELALINENRFTRILTFELSRPRTSDSNRTPRYNHVRGRLCCPGHPRQGNETTRSNQRAKAISVEGSVGERPL